MTADGFFSSNPARQMRLAMSAELPCKTKPRMQANRRELLLQTGPYSCPFVVSFC
jgi:hypothetical protein